jgi:hypothetical protein
MKKENKVIPYLTAEQKMMIKRRKWIDLGFKEKDYKQFEENVFRGYLSEDIAKTLQKTKEAQNEITDISKQIKEDSKKASMYFLLTVIVAIGSMLLSIALNFSS